MSRSSSSRHSVQASRSEEIKPHKVRCRDAKVEPKMAEVLCVYREVQVLKKAAAKAEKSKKPVAIVSYDEKPGIKAMATTAPDCRQCVMRPIDPCVAKFGGDKVRVNHQSLDSLLVILAD